MHRQAFTVGLMLAVATAGQAALIDDFSSEASLLAYTPTVILDANGGAANVAYPQIADGGLQLVTATYDGIEQYAFVRNGLSLAVGEEVQGEFNHNGASQDIGLYVGGTTPVTGIRQDYVAVYARATGELFSRGFDGTTEYGQVGWISPPYTKLFIARTDVNTYEAGYYEGAARNIMATRTPSFPNDGDVVGFYADVRAAGTLGTIDNLTVIPEPASLVLLGLGSLLAAARRRRA